MPVSLSSLLVRTGPGVALPLLGLGTLLLWKCILTAAGLGEKHRLVSVPLLAAQDVQFATAGRVALWVEGPMLSTRLAGVAYELGDSNGSAIKGRPNWFPLNSTSLSGTGRKLVRIFTIPDPGSYELRITGLGDPQAIDDDHLLVFMRPHLPETLLCILGIILGAFLTIASLLLLLWRRGLVGEAA